MADICSQAFKHSKFFQHSTNLKQYFSTHFPLPQPRSWTEFRVPKKLTWRVISCLLGEQSPMESLTRLPKLPKSIGHTGAHTHPSATPPQTSPASLTSTKPSSSPDMLQGSGQALSVTDLKSKFSPLVTPWQPSPRPSNWVENVVPPTKHRENSLLPSNDAWKDSAEMTTPPSHN